MGAFSEITRIGRQYAQQEYAVGRMGPYTDRAVARFRLHGPLDECCCNNNSHSYQATASAILRNYWRLSLRAVSAR